jgi:hypothetical protein
MKKQEENIHKAICDYLKLQYPNVYFTSESSGVRVPIGLAVKMKAQRSKHKQLDLIILEPKKGYCGLIIELKKDESEVYTIKGEIRNNAHVIEQQISINHLNNKGYLAKFGLGFKHTKAIIDNYLS